MLVIITIAVLILGSVNGTSLAWFEQSYGGVDTFVTNHFTASLVLFVSIYVFCVTLLVVPPSAPLSLASGLLFGPLIGTLLCLAAKTIGGTVAFGVWRNAFRGDISKLGPKTLRLAQGLSGSGF